jgi:DnaJ domain
MTLNEACEILGLDQKASRKEVRTAYRRTARLWHPDHAPAEQEVEYRLRMEQVNNAYQKLLQFIEDYRFEFVEKPSQDDLMKWWHNRFATGVWSPPPSPDPEKDKE